jgi:UDP-glucose 4-epimerase
MSILITGDAGYIGSHTAKFLDESGLDLVILDNLSTI